MTTYWSATAGGTGTTTISWIRITTSWAYGRLRLKVVLALEDILSWSTSMVRCAARSHEATTKFVQRVSELDASVVDRYDHCKPLDDPSRARRHLLVRGYKLDQEMAAFWRCLMHSPEAEKLAAIKGCVDTHIPLDAPVLDHLLFLTIGRPAP